MSLRPSIVIVTLMVSLLAGCSEMPFHKQDEPMIDNTPPTVTLSAPRRADDHVEVDADAADQTSPLRRVEYSLDAGPWTPVEAADGVTDSPREQYHIAIDHLRPGEHLLVVRAYDTANNAGLAKVVIR